jgi:maleylpyruvate isomerase
MENAVSLQADLDAIAVATDRLNSSIASLSDEQVRSPSLLPDWTIGHCLTHIARNADGISNLVQWAVTGVHTPMYPSMESRNADIERGASRSADELRYDVRESAQRLSASFVELFNAGAGAWSTLVLFGAPPAGTPADTPAGQVPYARLREVTIHHADLGLPDFTFRDVDQSFVTRTLAFIDGRSGPIEVTGPATDILQWRLGRGIPASVRDVNGDPVGAAPAW